MFWNGLWPGITGLAPERLQSTWLTHFCSSPKPVRSSFHFTDANESQEAGIRPDSRNQRAS